MTQHFDLFIPGVKTAASTLSVYAPYDRQLIGSVATANQEMVDHALDNAQSLFNNRSRWLKADERLAILKKRQN